MFFNGYGYPFPSVTQYFKVKFKYDKYDKKLNMINLALFVF